MRFLSKATMIPFAVVAWFTLGSSIAAEQMNEKQGQEERQIFKGLHKKQGVDGRPSTALVTDGKTYVDISEQEYRERGYSPPFDKLPVLIIQRIPVQAPALQGQEK